MNIVLIGFMCSGKSRVGQILAKKLGRLHFDTDEMITKDVGATIADIIKKEGETAFRAVEKKAVELVVSFNDAVISTGGGVPLDRHNMALLKKNGQLVWLKVTPETVLKRAGNLKSRPLIDPQDPLGSIQKRMAEREPAYAQAQHQLDSDEISPEATADKIIELLSLKTA